MLERQDKHRLDDVNSVEGIEPCNAAYDSFDTLELSRSLGGLLREIGSQGGESLLELLICL